MPTDKSKSFLDDKESLEALISKLPEIERQEYRSYGALTLEAAFPHRKLVVYTLKSGAPEEVEVLTCSAIWMPKDEAPRATVSSRRHSAEVGAVPIRWRYKDLFLHIPQNFALKWKGKRTADGEIGFVAQYALLLKTRSREHAQLDGHTYCTTYNRFRERFPDSKISLREIPQGGLRRNGHNHQAS